MTALQWRAELSNNLPAMDRTHQEFVVHYAGLVEAMTGGDAAALLSALDDFIRHTEQHFDQENRWMADIDFPGCHRAEHERVLQVLRDIRGQVAAGDLFFAKRLVQELPAWFEGHVDGMDAALAFHIQTIGYDVDAPAGTQPGCAGAGRLACHGAGGVPAGCGTEPAVSASASV